MMAVVPGKVTRITPPNFAFGDTLCSVCQDQLRQSSAKSMSEGPFSSVTALNKSLLL